MGLGPMLPNVSIPKYQNGPCIAVLIMLLDMTSLHFVSQRDNCNVVVPNIGASLIIRPI